MQRYEEHMEEEEQEPRDHFGGPVVERVTPLRDLRKLASVPQNILNRNTQLVEELFSGSPTLVAQTQGSSILTDALEDLTDVDTPTLPVGGGGGERRCVGSGYAGEPGIGRCKYGHEMESDWYYWHGIKHSLLEVARWEERHTFDSVSGEQLSWD
ncbi:hypothetical protein KIPB_001749 [Kipferlia bialata]|uniref:Uncharacterized protein n=1 Tax=Kipferlia bialata TaxID=797122 RepID=A0A391NJ12_9EUKA|nr:hypothetical protein KIPB_001749 [Kipferlia bialata]|eukprot:g1749.t1